PVLSRRAVPAAQPAQDPEHATRREDERQGPERAREIDERDGERQGPAMRSLRQEHLREPVAEFARGKQGSGHTEKEDEREDEEWNPQGQTACAHVPDGDEPRAPTRRTWRDGQRERRGERKQLEAAESKPFAGCGEREAGGCERGPPHAGPL